MFWKNSNEKYTGEWANDLPDGKGVQIWYDQRSEQTCLINRYVGEWKKGCREGYGIYYYSNGSIYEGTWKNNFKDGFGIFTYVDGKKYLGLFSKDLMSEIQNPVTLEMVEKVLPLISKKKKNSNAVNNNVSPGKKGIANKAISKNNQNVTSNNNSNQNNNANNNDHNIDENISKDNLKNSINRDDKKQQGYISRKPKEKENQKEQKNKSLNKFIPFLDLADLIEINKDISSNIKEIQNLFLRNLSEIKKSYLNSTKNELENEDQKEKNEFINANTNSNNIHINNNLCYCMRLKELWRFIRTIGINSFDFSLADFDRLFYNDYVNQFNMFNIPSELNRNESYEYLMKSIKDSKENFVFINNKYIQYYNYNYKGENELINYLFNIFDGVDDVDTCNTPKNNKDQFKLNKDIPELMLPQSEKGNKTNLNIHDKNHVILLRNFYSAILRIAYLKFIKETNMKFEEKLLKVFNMCNLTIPIFKKGGANKSSISKLESSSIKKENKDLIEHIKLINSEYAYIDNFCKENEMKLKPLFTCLYINMHKLQIYNFTDMTITYGYFYKNVILKSKIFIGLFENKFSFCEIINHFDREKMNFVNDEYAAINGKNISKFEYIEILFDKEMIFYEFQEMIFFIYKKYLLTKKVKKAEEDKHYKKKLLHHLNKLIIKSECLNKPRIVNQYYYPKQIKHEKKEKLMAIIQNELEKKRIEQLEIERYTNERNKMVHEDENAYKEKEKESDEEEEEEST